MRLVKNLDHLPERSKKVHRPVSRAIIYYYDLKVGESLRKNRLQRPLQERNSIKRGNNNRKHDISLITRVHSVFLGSTIWAVGTRFLLAAFTNDSHVVIFSRPLKLAPALFRHHHYAGPRSITGAKSSPIHHR